MGTRHPEYARADGDFYVEPSWTVSALFRHVALRGKLHDPCCGSGTIIETAIQQGFEASGADIADRANGRFPVRDFLTDSTTYPNLITNPPYKLAVEIICHALTRVPDGGHVAALVPIGFLASIRRHSLFVRPECEMVLVLSRRPGLPPGELLKQHGEAIRCNGSTDFIWSIWRRGRAADGAAICWAPP